jgi:hypothetical protein
VERTGRLVNAQFPDAAVYASSTARTIRALALIWLEGARPDGPPVLNKKENQDG